jgi:phosphoserine phosphatase
MRSTSAPPRFGTVIFDCDSTLSAIEGIDVLAAAHREEVARLTDAAMRGEIPLDAVYGRRLALARPTREMVAALAAEYVARLVPDARETVDALRAAGVEVRVLSGGVRPAVLAVARALALPDDAVGAVDVRFGEDGGYAGFDDRSPLARAGGKREQLERWLPSLPRPIMIVGDGSTDAEARPPADCFVAFAGVVERPAVVAVADVVVRARSLAPIVPLALGDAAPADPAARSVYDKGLEMLNGDVGRGTREDFRERLPLPTSHFPEPS